MGADHAQAGPAPTASPMLPAGLPDDWVLQHDLPCPNCRYNLRMLREPRCPECGSVFRWQEALLVDCPRCAQSLHDVDDDACPRCALILDWAALLADAPTAKRKLYEYSERPFVAGVRTWFAALLPRRFWRRIPIEFAPATPRLRRLRAIAAGIGLVGLLAPVSAGLARSAYGAWMTMFAIAVGLPLLTTLMLPRFTPTFARFRIRQDQVLRCLAYGVLGLGWIGILLLTFSVTAYVVNRHIGGVAPGGWPPGPWFSIGLRLDFFDFLQPSNSLRWVWVRWNSTVSYNLLVCTLFAAMALGWWWRFLYVGLRHYLQLRRTDAVALFASTQVIALLAILLFLSGALLLTRDGRFFLAEW